MDTPTNRSLTSPRTFGDLFIRLRSNRGIFFELTAVIIFVVLVILFSVGYDAGYVKLVSARTRILLEQACKSGARQLPITSHALKSAAAVLRSGILSSTSGQPQLGGQVTSFKLILPTSPDVGRTNMGPPTAPIPADLSFSCNPPSPSCVHGYYDVEAPSITPDFPPNFWSQKNFNDALACQAEVSVRTLMSGTKTVKVNVAWEIRQIGAAYPAPGAPLLPGLPTERGQHGGGLIIVVDPTMTTDVAAGTRFLTTLLPIPNAVRGLGLDPLRVIPNPSPTPPTAPFPAILPFSGNRPSYTPGLMPNPALAGAARIQRVHACMNLPIAVRNRFLVGIVGRARGWLRDKLAVYVANPYHRYERDHFEPGYIAEEPNPPSVMVQGGFDTTRPIFQLPYVRYGVGGKGAVELDPFLTNPSKDDAERDRLLMGQLRDCYHLFHLSGDQGINRVIDPATQNLGYESVAVNNASQLPTLVPQYDPTLGNFPWDQEEGLPPSDAPLRAAEQVVAMLGSVQICPHGGTSAGGPACDESGAKPPPGEDLRGDIRGALMAVNGGRIMPNGDIVPFPAYAPTTLPGKGPSEMVFSKYASVLLVLSRALAIEEVAGIREQVNIFRNSPALGRRIIVAYFPTNLTDSSEAALTLLREAFDIVPPPPGPTPPIPAQDPARLAYLYPSETRNLLFVFKPLAQPTLPFTMAYFTNYWQQLLLQGQGGMSGRSQAIFNHIFTPSPKL